MRAGPSRGHTLHCHGKPTRGTYISGKSISMDCTAPVCAPGCREVALLTITHAQHSALGYHSTWLDSFHATPTISPNTVHQLFFMLVYEQPQGLDDVQLCTGTDQGSCLWVLPGSLADPTCGRAPQRQGRPDLSLWPAAGALHRVQRTNYACCLLGHLLWLVLKCVSDEQRCERNARAACSRWRWRGGAALSAQIRKSQ